MSMSPRLLRPRASGFSPKNISGLQLWLDASDSAVLFDATSGGALPAANAGVARWVDKSSNAYEFTQSTANNRPIRKVASQNGKDGLLFDASNDSLYKSAALFTTGVTVALVFKLTSTTNRSPVIDLGNYGSSFKSLTIEANTYFTAGGKYGLYIANSLPNNSTYDSSHATSTSACVLVYAGSHNLGDDVTLNSYRLNGSSGTLTRKAGTSDASDSYSGVSGVMLGAFNNNGTAQTFGGTTLYEVIAYNRVLASIEIQTIEAALKTKWGVT